MSIQSLMTPAMFMVSAEVFPISRKTACGVPADYVTIARQQTSVMAAHLFRFRGCTPPRTKCVPVT